jgi:transposase
MQRGTMNFSKYNVMPQPYSEDLRWRVVWLCLFHHKSELEVANLLHISTKTVERYLECFLSTGNVAPDQRKNGPDKILSMYEEMLLIQILFDQPTIYLHEIQYQLLQVTGTSVACSTICRALKKLDNRSAMLLCNKAVMNGCNL